EKAEKLQAQLGTQPYDDYNLFEPLLKKTLKAQGLALDKTESKQLLDAVTWKNPDAEKVIKKLHKKKQADAQYGLFPAGADAVEYQADADLRDYENVRLNPAISVTESTETYFAKEVAPHVPDAWIDASKRDDKDGEIGIVGYEIPFNRHFYVYQPPRSLKEIDSDLDKVTSEILALL